LPKQAASAATSNTTSTPSFTISSSLRRHDRPSKVANEREMIGELNDEQIEDDTRFKAFFRLSLI
jgi:hypothetical protein